MLQTPDITAPASPLAASIAGTASAATNFTASGSTPITWSVSGGALPPGMALDAATGAYTGTPTATGNFTFTVSATNAAGSDSSPYTQQVNAPALNAQALIGGNRIAAFATSVPRRARDAHRDHRPQHRRDAREHRSPPAERLPLRSRLQRRRGHRAAVFDFRAHRCCHPHRQHW